MAYEYEILKLLNYYLKFNMNSEIIKQHTKIMLDSIERFEDERNQIFAKFEKERNQILDNWLHNLKVMLEYQDYVLENNYIPFDEWLESKADEEMWAKEDARVEQE